MFRGTCSKVLRLSTARANADNIAGSNRLFLLRMVPSCMARNLVVANSGEDELRKKLKELHEVRRQMDELDKEFESFFTVDYVQKLSQRRSKAVEPEPESDDDSSSDCSDSGLEDRASQ